MKEKFALHKIKEPSDKGYVSSIQYIDEMFNELALRRRKIKNLNKQIEELRSIEKDSVLP